jgi:hypothetical protein
VEERARVRYLGFEHAHAKPRMCDPCGAHSALDRGNLCGLAGVLLLWFARVCSLWKSFCTTGIQATFWRMAAKGERDGRRRCLAEWRNGRRTGFKILFPVREVRVRVPPRLLNSYQLIRKEQKHFAKSRAGLGLRTPTATHAKLCGGLLHLILHHRCTGFYTAGRNRHCGRSRFGKVRIRDCQ